MDTKARLVHMPEARFDSVGPFITLTFAWETKEGKTIYRAVQVYAGMTTSQLIDILREV